MIDMNVSWHYKFLCYDNGTNKTIGESWTYSWELMIHLLNGHPKILWSDYSAL